MPRPPPSQLLSSIASPPHKTASRPTASKTIRIKTSTLADSEDRHLEVSEEDSATEEVLEEDSVDLENEIETKKEDHFYNPLSAIIFKKKI